MPVSFSDLQLALEFVSSGGIGENEAYLDRQSGKIYWHSEFGENDAKLLDDIENEKYIAIPDKRPHSPMSGGAAGSLVKKCARSTTTHARSCMTRPDLR
jgi:hypothetical protein